MPKKIFSRKTREVKLAVKAKRKKAEQGAWIPGSNGTETPFYTRTGARLLYCYQPSTGKHAYLNCDTDMIISDDEANQLLAIR